MISPEAGSLDEEKDEEEQASKPDLEPHSGPRISIATLLRDDVTGQLIVKVGDTEYHNPDDLRASNATIGPALNLPHLTSKPG